MAVSVSVFQSSARTSEVTSVAEKNGVSVWRSCKAIAWHATPESAAVCAFSIRGFCSLQKSSPDKIVAWMSESGLFLDSFSVVDAFGRPHSSEYLRSASTSAGVSERRNNGAGWTVSCSACIADPEKRNEFEPEKRENE